MSHASGEVRFNDGTVRYVEYNGTCDVLYPLSYDTFEEMEANWRKFPQEPNCKHEKLENADFYGYYGKGIGWEVTCCRECGWITKNLVRPEPDTYEYPLFYSEEE